MSLLTLYTLGGSGVVAPETGTTYCTVRDAIIATLEAATPSLISDARYEAAPRAYGTAKWGQSSSAALRRFDLRRQDLGELPYGDGSLCERREVVILSVLYPALPGLYGHDDWDEIERVMRTDARQLRDLITSYGNYVTGQIAAFVRALTPSRQGSVWVQQFEITLLYFEAQQLS